MTIRVAVVDDQQLVRAGFAMVIDSQPDMAVSWQAGDGREALGRLSTDPVDIVIMDVQMPGLDGIEATRRALAADPAPRVVVLTTFDIDRYVLDAIAAGASGFLLKDADPEQLLASIRTVAGAMRHCPPAPPAGSSTTYDRGSVRASRRSRRWWRD